MRLLTGDSNRSCGVNDVHHLLFEAHCLSSCTLSFSKFQTNELSSLSSPCSASSGPVGTSLLPDRAPPTLLSCLDGKLLQGGVQWCYRELSDGTIHITSAANPGAPPPLHPGPLANRVGQGTAVQSHCVKPPEPPHQCPIYQGVLGGSDLRLQPTSLGCSCLNFWSYKERGATVQEEGSQEKKEGGKKPQTKPLLRVAPAMGLSRLFCASPASASAGSAHWEMSCSWGVPKLP